MDNFYEKLHKQLKKMTEQEKDAWILSQAKILPEWEQEDFYKSVCGTKKIIHMPEISENHLEKEEEPYIILIDYYKNRNHEKAVETANLAIQKCKKDQTPFFLFLLQDAKDRGDEALFKKLMQSAHRRRTVRSAEIDEKFPITTS